jgi:hypothetical protein
MPVKRLGSRPTYGDRHPGLEVEQQGLRPSLTRTGDVLVQRHIGESVGGSAIMSLRELGGDDVEWKDPPDGDDHGRGLSGQNGP